MLIDYSNNFKKEEKSISKQENHIIEKRKRFSLAGLKEYWFSYDKNTKIKIIIFFVAVVAIFGILIFYFLSPSQSRGKTIYFPSNYDKKMFFKQ